MNREAALQLMTDCLGNRNLQKHCLATETVFMKNPLPGVLTGNKWLLVAI
ncbi:MAG: hypothetical protein ACYC2T_07965 [Bacillota bacterium]